MLPYSSATTQLMQQFAPLHLAHPLANAAWTIPGPGDSHIAGRKESDRPARRELFPEKDKQFSCQSLKH